MSERLIRLSPFEQGKLITRELFAPAVPEMFQAARELCAQSDVVIGHYYHHPLRTAAEASNVPAVTVTISPDILVSRSYPPTGVPSLGPRWNRMWWHVAYRLVNRAFLPDVNKLRLEAGLPAIQTVREVWHSRLLDLVAVSPALFPAEPDWDPRHKVCGFFEWPTNSQDSQLPEAVEEFLCAGDPPVFFGFGSLSPNQPPARRQLLSLFTEAVERRGCRAIFQGLAPGMETTGHILHVERVNHARLFPPFLFVQPFQINVHWAIPNDAKAPRAFTVALEHGVTVAIPDGNGGMRCWRSPGRAGRSWPSGNPVR